MPAYRVADGIRSAAPTIVPRSSTHSSPLLALLHHLHHPRARRLSLMVLTGSLTTPPLHLFSDNSSHHGICLLFSLLFPPVNPFSCARAPKKERRQHLLLTQCAPSARLYYGPIPRAGQAHPPPLISAGKAPFQRKPTGRQGHAAAQAVRCSERASAWLLIRAGRLRPRSHTRSR